MWVVVNKLPLSKPIDADLIASVDKEFIPGARRLPGFVSLQLIRNSDTEAVVLAHFEDRESLDRISSEYAAPWFQQHVQHYLVGPPQRTVGEMIVGS